MAAPGLVAGGDDFSGERLRCVDHAVGVSVLTLGDAGDATSLRSNDGTTLYVASVSGEATTLWSVPQ